MNIIHVVLWVRCRVGVCCLYLFKLHRSEVWLSQRARCCCSQGGFIEHCVVSPSCIFHVVLIVCLFVCIAGDTDRCLRAVLFCWFASRALEMRYLFEPSVPFSLLAKYQQPCLQNECLGFTVQLSDWHKLAHYCLCTQLKSHVFSSCSTV